MQARFFIRTPASILALAGPPATRKLPARLTPQRYQPPPPALLLLFLVLVLFLFLVLFLLLRLLTDVWP